MQHFGLICPPLSSHVTGMTAIARELVHRGHRATMFNIADARGLTESEGIEFVTIGAEDHPEGSLAEFSRAVARLKGIQALRFGIRAAEKEADSLLREVPDAMMLHGVTAIVGDQGSPVCSSIAGRLGIPFFSVCNAIAANRDPSLPPSFAGWMPGDGPLIRLRNRVGNLLVDSAVRPITRTINRYRSQWGLPELRKLEETFSPRAQISQQSEEFDFPNPSRPPHFHYIGLLLRSASDSVPFPFERLDGRPVIYASLGTVMGSAPGVYRKLALACEGLPVQLVITLGGAAETVEHENLPGDPIVVQRVPQLAILRHAALTFCHAGLNTVLESLSFGVPVLALPMVTDQFAVGARLMRSGAGEAITRKQFDSRSLRPTISRLLTEPSYRARAAEMAISLQKSGGEKRAADIIEHAMEALGVYSDGSALSIADTSVVIPA